ncbi:MAG: glycoside hydrolase family 3 C-terminal domain-containing protein [Clostridia bacterium]|nr:glycoside hydrolase family 3 C-terminal domain-containing protein [Clostridia bacterium]MBO7157418.1 glycoside hydrolase family 3 C-terminal domain-containing protein [Clostridia bacterium]
MKTILSQLTLEEKAALLTGAASMATAEISRLGIKGKNLADGPHGVRSNREDNCTHFPNLCCLGASWDVEAAYKMGKGIGDDCIEHDVQMILGPGVNIKRTPLCGRNFEYVSEDPVLAGEIVAGYIRGAEDQGVATCLKHYAMNNQEKYRLDASVDADERTMREIYLRPFEIAVEKGNPTGIMCAYNKVNSIWCSENKQLLTEILKEEWGYEGMVVSDWGAVHNIAKAVAAGLDLEMPNNWIILEQLKAGLENGDVTMEQIDAAVERVLPFATRAIPEKKPYDRDAQHSLVREIAAGSIVLLQNRDEVLPLTSEKYKKIAVVGEYAVNPLYSGQGSAEVLQTPEYTDSPLEELKKLLPETEFLYGEYYQKAAYSKEMLWPKLGEFMDFARQADAVLLFVGAQESEDTEKFDRRTLRMNPNYDMYVEAAIRTGKPTIVVCQSGSAVVFDEDTRNAHAIVQMWLAGEAAGGAIADVLTGKVNPSGKLSETFPKEPRTDLQYPGNGHYIEYTERFRVGYRYYDLHPEEILFPFGHGLSYTSFWYSNLSVEKKEDGWQVSFDVTNNGSLYGAEVAQLYICDPVSTVPKPVKELKKFKKLRLAPGETQSVSFTLTERDLSYYNVSLHRWVAEDGKYHILVGSSSQDIRLQGTILHTNGKDYTIRRVGVDMIG